jgi:predicted ATPase
MHERAPAPSGPSPATAASKTNVRELATTFFGRADELSRLEAVFAAGNRVVTVIGPAGSGKTRLAKRYCVLHQAEFMQADGVWFCDLTEALTRDEIATCVAEDLGIPIDRQAAQGGAVEQVGRALAGRGPILLLLDNCEHVATDLAWVLGDWRAASGEARFLATSRERLGLDAETLFELKPFPLPQDGPDGSSSEAVRLFADRARLVRPDYVVGEGDLDVIVQIVRALDGLPLAVELAAARMRVMSASALLDRLDKRFDVLADRGHRGPPRHATLRAAIDVSWTLLQDWEQAALCQCAVFRGGFSLEAAEAVVDLSAFTAAGSVLDALQALRDKSLVYAETPPELGSDLRLGLYESIREYAAERLIDSGDAEAVYGRHTAYFLRAGADWAERTRVGSPQHSRKLTLEIGNVRAVHERALDAGTPDALRAALILTEIYRRAGTPSAVLAMLDTTIRQTSDPGDTHRQDPSLLAGVLLRRAWALYRLGRPAEGRVDAEQARALAGEANDVYVGACAEHRLGLLALVTCGESTELPLRHLTAARAGFHAAGCRAEEARVLTDIAVAHSKTGRVSTARELLREALAIAEAAGAEAATAHARSAFAVTALELGMLAEAEVALDEARTSFHRLGDSPSYFMTLIYRGFLHLERGEYERAEAMYREVLGQRTSVYPLVRGQASAALGVLLATCGAVEEARRALDQADLTLGPLSGESAAMANVLRGHLDLAIARDSAPDGEDRGAHRVRAERRLSAGATWAERSDDVRIALRWLGRALEKVSAEHLYAREALVVASDGAWFRVPLGWRTDIGTRQHERALLQALVRARLEEPSRALTRAELLSAGWPGERIQPARAGANRVYVAVATLRELGLRGLLQSTDDGYMLDPNVPLLVAR